MANSKCGHCDGTIFEIREVQPRGSEYKFNFIQCASCGVAIGVVSFYNLEAQILETHKFVERILERLQA